MNQLNTLINIPDEIIISKIFVIRNLKVMIDSDLAELYQVETKVLNQAVSRNIKRFPNDFMFQLNSSEWEILKSQFVTSSWGGKRKLPFVFTEHGVLMLSSVLKSDRSIQVNIQIMRVFTYMRQKLIENTDIRLSVEKLERKTENNSKNIELVFQYIDELGSKKNSNKIQRKKIGYKMPKKKI